MEIDEADAGTVKSADRTLDLLELLARWGHEMSHAEIAEALEIPKSSLTKLLKNLSARGYIRFVPETKGYRLGEAVTKLARQASEQRDLVACAKPFLSEITRRTKESCALNLLKGDQIEVVATELSPHRLVSHLRPGDLAPLYAVSGGKAILAFLPDVMRDEYLGSIRLERITPRTLTTKKALLGQLDEIRRTGVAYSFEEYTPGIVGVGVPILSAAGFPLGALNLAIPAVRFNDDMSASAVTALRSAADQINRQFSA